MKKLILFLSMFFFAKASLECMQLGFPKLIYLGFPAKIIRKGKFSELLKKQQGEIAESLKENLSEINQDLERAYLSIEDESLHIVLTVPIKVNAQTQISMFTNFLTKQCQTMEAFNITKNGIEHLYNQQYIALTFTMPQEITENLNSWLKAVVEHYRLKWPEGSYIPHCKLLVKSRLLDLRKIKNKIMKSEEKEKHLETILLKSILRKVTNLNPKVKPIVNNTQLLDSLPQFGIKINKLYLLEGTGMGTFKELAEFKLMS